MPFFCDFLWYNFRIRIQGGETELNYLLVFFRNFCQNWLDAQKKMGMITAGERTQSIKETK